MARSLGVPHSIPSQQVSGRQLHSAPAHYCHSLAVQKLLSKDDSFAKCFAERRSIKVSSFTNAKLCPVWYYKLYIPTDNMDEIMMNAGLVNQFFKVIFVFFQP